MSYQVLARKWRPQKFSEVVGQDHIGRTLKNAIMQNRIGHAYLFIGSRGIGKTTTARIFAKALNCTHNVDGEPCCKCENCKEVADGTSLDVIEIDGASHNKVEDIREIRDNVQYAPVKSKYKIYIIDEVHMLTTAAWNALLKTLEEPPEHVKFLFATTEPHKVLPTIISRCQRFDLRRIPVPLIAKCLRGIADGEHINVEETALTAIARAANGGMRDAQSIFDQMISFCGGTDPSSRPITEQNVIEVFGLASSEELRQIAVAIFANDLDGVMTVMQNLADSGLDLERLFEDLIYFVRNLMIAVSCHDSKRFLEVSEMEYNEMMRMGQSLDPQLIQRVLQGLVTQEWAFRSALNKRVFLEVVLARVMREAHSVQINEVIQHLNVISGLLPKEKMPAPRPPFVVKNNAKAVLTASNIEELSTPEEVVPKEDTPEAEVPEDEVSEPEVSEEDTPEEEVSEPEVSEEDTPEEEVSEPEVSEEDTPEDEVLEPEVSEEDTPEEEVAEPEASEEDTPEEEVSEAEVSEEDTLEEEVSEPEVSEEDTLEEEESDCESELGERFVVSEFSSAKDCQKALIEELKKRGEIGVKLAEIVSGLAPQDCANHVLTLYYDKKEITEWNLRALKDTDNSKMIQNAFRSLIDLGAVVIKRNPFVEKEEHPGFRHVIGDEQNALQDYPLVKTFNRLMNTKIVDVVVREDPKAPQNISE